MSAGALAGRVAVVTGASRGVGLAVAEALRAAGAHVARLARSLADAEAERDTTLRCDVTDPAAVERAAARIRDGLGVPDIVVNNAGTFLVKPLPETTPGEFTGMLAVNLAAPFFLLRALLPALVRRGHGHVVTIGSVSDYRAFSGNAAYAASKWGVRGLHEVLLAELRGTGIRATLVSPGPVDTDIWTPVDPDARPGFTKRRDMLRAEDVAEAVLWAVTRPPRVDVTELRLMPAAYTPRS